MEHTEPTRGTDFLRTMVAEDIASGRFGGRIVFAIVMAITLVPAFLIGLVSSYWQLLLCGFFIGIALAVFSVGVGFVSGWYPPERQGAALGIYGAGNVGQSLAAFGSPLIAGALGFRWGFWESQLANLIFWSLLAAGSLSYDVSLESVLRLQSALDFTPELIIYLAVAAMIGILAEGKSIRSEEYAITRIVESLRQESGFEAQPDSPSLFINRLAQLSCVHCPKVFLVPGNFPTQAGILCQVLVEIGSQGNDNAQRTVFNSNSI